MLILDTPNSDLDNVTERKVHDAIENVAQAKTLIVITHRLSTIEGADEIYYLDQEKIVDSGTFYELTKHCPKFRDMAEVSG